MNKYLPSKKFIKFISIVLIVAILVWVVSMIFSKREVFKNESGKKGIALARASDGEDLYKKDSDGDGVPDWEETLWGTDPYNKDTYGNGLGDATEIANRKKTIQERNDLEGVAINDDSQNNTAKLAKQFLVTASLAQQQGGIDEMALKNFSKSLDGAFANAQLADMFDVKDLKLGSVTPAKYKENLNKVFQYFLDTNTEELEVVFKLVSGENTDNQINILDEKIKIYKDLSENVLKTEAPYLAAGFHLQIANNASKVAIALIGIKNLNEDPLSGMIAFQQYQKYSEALQKALTSLQNYFVTNGII